jgi:hypothetical protein
MIYAVGNAELECCRYQTSLHIFQIDERLYDIAKQNCISNSCNKLDFHSQLIEVILTVSTLKISVVLQGMIITVGYEITYIYATSFTA